MDVDLLKTFLEVHKTRHFGKAAENLFITQSAVSARIRQLEEILGVRLFHRDRKNIQPTACGEKLIAHAENIISMWNRVKLD
ncbi:MAG: LysR family transcriptional regulator, partial [Gammaproteobacteria bacterium]|nr:LysR family transcriptional regulator [Gammaproteobacteria bacterium]